MMQNRLYTFVNNVYLSEKQCGIQSLHVLGDIVLKYGSGNLIVKKYLKDKTMIMLKGGNSNGVACKYEVMKDKGYPCALFHEDQESLGGAITACGIILPENVWATEKTPYTDGLGNSSYIWRGPFNSAYTYGSNTPEAILIRLIQDGELV